MNDLSDDRIDAARRAAERLLASPLVGDPLARTRGRLATPIPIRHPAHGAVDGWFVGVLVDDRLIGFLQLTAGREMRRYASFPRHADAPAPGVAPDLWLDPDRVRHRAAALARDDEILSTPVLTYDRSPDRLAWRLEATPPDGQPRHIWLAGEAAWSEPADPGDEPVTGGPPG